MDEITLKNFRCFHGAQTARLAPLTLLVGENSTGKTSFLAMVRALWELAFHNKVPNFKEPPYDLGSFDEIAHHRGVRGRRTEEVLAAFETRLRTASRTGSTPGPDKTLKFRATFRKRGTAPFPTELKLSHGSSWVQKRLWNHRSRLRFGTARRSWEIPGYDRPVSHRRPQIAELLPFWLAHGSQGPGFLNGGYEFQVIKGKRQPRRNDFAKMSELNRQMELQIPGPCTKLYASSPVHSVPRRTYDPGPIGNDPEGEYVPMYLADIFFHNKVEWNALKTGLEEFGRMSGLFDEIAVHPLGTKDTEPFQLQVRKCAGRRMGPMRNLIDVGYGVSQALPVLIELLRRECSPICLLQQPEACLHPSAQAALGSLFCKVAGPDRQLLVVRHTVTTSSIG